MYHPAQVFPYLVLFWVLLRINRRVFLPQLFLRVLIVLFQCCSFIRLFCYDLRYFTPKLFCFLLVWFLVMSSCILPLHAGRIFFHCFGMSWFVYIVWFCLGIFLVFLLSPVPFNLFPWIVSFVLIMLLFSFRPIIFYRFSSVFAFLLVVVDILFVLPV